MLINVNLIPTYRKTYFEQPRIRYNITGLATYNLYVNHELQNI